MMMTMAQCNQRRCARNHFFGANSFDHVRPCSVLGVVLLAICWLTIFPRAELRAAEAALETENRLRAAAGFLASDELEGRGLGTSGLDRAADYIAAEFARVGLDTLAYQGTPFQSFEVTATTELGPADENVLELVGPPGESADEATRIQLSLGENLSPLSIGGSASFDAPLVFVGYGITSKEHEYDEYDGLDVEGKIVLILRKEPQQSNPHSAFDGTEPTRHAWFATKVSNAFEHGAAGVIMVNDQFGIDQRIDIGHKAWQDAVDQMVAAHREYLELEAPDEARQKKYRETINQLADRIAKEGSRTAQDADELVSFQGAGQGNSRPRFPVIFARREPFDQVLRSATDSDLTEIERQIDTDLQPRSQLLAGWTARGQTSVRREKVEVRNVIGVLPGSGPLADETVVVGAHYDHLGMGGQGNSLAPWTREIHNGADDNASGVAVLIEVAARLAAAPQRPSRRIVFIAFTGEERGLIGSSRYVQEPRFQLENTVAMLNMDMVGRLQDDKLIVHGTGTATTFDAMVDDLNSSYDFEITKSPGGFGPSDHTSFYTKKIPVLHIFTGSHRDYHRPSDDVDKLNIIGMRRIGEFVGDITAAIAGADERPVYQETKRPEMARGGSRPYLGSIPDFSREVEGYALMGVSPGSPAERAGIKEGDVIIQFGESKIGGLEDIDGALRKYKAGDSVPVVVLRGEDEQTISVTLDPPK